MSWAGKILRVNLTAGTVKSEPLNMEWAQAYLGSRGLGTKYLVEEVDATVDPLSPENKIIWATGPLTGTMASTGGRYTVITKGPLTGAIACGNSGGYWGAEFKMAGWDMVIFEGKSEKPVYLYVNDDVVELRDAAHLWGKSVWETEAMIKKGLQDPLIRVSSIGTAGENGVLFAAVVNDLHRAAGRSGVGAVMGSKNLKAIAVRGTKGVGNIRDPKAFMKVIAEKKKILADNSVTGQGLPIYGTQVLMNVIIEVGVIPTRNYRDDQFEGAKDISAEAMATPRKTDGKKHLVTNQACFGRTIACGRISKMDENHFTIQNKPQYRGALGGLEYESAWPTPRPTAVAATCAATRLRPKCWASRSRPIRSSMKASPSWSRPSRTRPQPLTRQACASSPRLPGAWPTWHRKWQRPAASSSPPKSWRKLANASGTWSVSSTTGPALPPRTTACHRACSMNPARPARPRARSTCSPR